MSWKACCFFQWLSSDAKDKPSPINPSGNTLTNDGHTFFEELIKPKDLKKSSLEQVQQSSKLERLVIFHYPDHASIINNACKMLDSACFEKVIDLDEDDFEIFRLMCESEKYGNGSEIKNNALMMFLNNEKGAREKTKNYLAKQPGSPDMTADTEPKTICCLRLRW